MNSFGIQPPSQSGNRRSAGSGRRKGFPRFRDNRIERKRDSIPDYDEEQEDEFELQREQQLSLETPDWLASPCYGCGSHCCSHLPLCDLKIDTRTDLLALADLCWFEGMVPVLKANGEWRLFFHAQCLHLHRETGKCRIHLTAEQSDICRNYPSQRCWYRKAFETAETDLLLRFTGARVGRLIEMIGFDDNGEIEQVPAWEVMQRELAAVPYQTASLPAPRGTMLDAREEDDLLLFPPGRPQKPEHLDLLKFRLGFPGLMILISYSHWCFALPAVVRPAVPTALAAALRRRLDAGVYDRLIEGITDQERFLLRTGAFQRIERYDSVQLAGIVPTDLPGPRQNDPEQLNP